MDTDIVSKMDNSREKWMKWIKNREKKFVPLSLSIKRLTSPEASVPSPR